MDALREQLAAYAHDEAWGHWMRYLLGVCRLEPDGSVVIPPDKAVRWMRQATTVYAELPDDERESDRRQADRILAIVGQPAAGPDDEIHIEDSGSVRSVPNPRTPLHIQEPPAAAEGRLVLLVDSPAAEPDPLAIAAVELSTWAAAINWDSQDNQQFWYDGLRLRIDRVQELAKQAGVPVGGMRIDPARWEPDPIAHLVPPADQWPADAEAWCVEASGHAYWHVASRDGRWELYPDHWVPLPPNFDWRRSLRLRPQTGA